MTDHNESDAKRINDAAVGEPPTVEGILERQRVEEARTSVIAQPMSDEERAVIEAGGDPVPGSGDRELDIEGPNSA